MDANAVSLAIAPDVIFSGTRLIGDRRYKLIIDHPRVDIGAIPAEILELYNATRPSAVELEEGDRYTKLACSHCAAPRSRLLCSCRRAFYCSAECREAHLPVHQRDCWTRQACILCKPVEWRSTSDDGPVRDTMIVSLAVQPDAPERFKVFSRPLDAMSVQRLFDSQMEWLQRRCLCCSNDGCFKRAVGKCGCQQVYYCSLQCQRAHRSTHKPACFLKYVHVRASCKPDAGHTNVMRVSADTELTYNRVKNLLSSDNNMMYVLEAAIMRNLDHKQDMPPMHMDVLEKLMCVQMRLARDKVAASDLYRGERDPHGGLSRSDKRLLSRILEYIVPHIRVFVACHGTEGTRGELCVTMIAGLCRLVDELNRVPKPEIGRLVHACITYADAVSMKPGGESVVPAAWEFETAHTRIRNVCHKLVLLDDECRTR
jgi:MYND finger